MKNLNGKINKIIILHTNIIDNAIVTHCIMCNIIER